MAIFCYINLAGIGVKCTRKISSLILKLASTFSTHNLSKFFVIYFDSQLTCLPQALAKNEADKKVLLEKLVEIQVLLKMFKLNLNIIMAEESAQVQICI